MEQYTTQSNLSNISAIVPEISDGNVHTRFDVTERRKAKWKINKKIFVLMTIVGQNLDSTNKYGKLRQTLIDEIMACNATRLGPPRK